MSRRAQLVGTRLALVGTILYLLEWAVIPFAPDLPTDQLGGGDAATTVAAYAEEATTVAFLTGWLTFVLLGRIVFVAAVRSVLRGSPREGALMDIALGAMAVSVAIEVVQNGLIATAGRLAENDADAAAVVALDAAGSLLFYAVIAPIGVSVLATSLAMLVSGLFARWICWLGLVAGLLVVAGGILGTTGVGASGTLEDLVDPLSGPPVALFWLWMIATSVILFRHAPQRRRQPAAV